MRTATLAVVSLALASGPAGANQQLTVTTTQMVFSLIPAGTYTMGGNGHGAAHPATITKPFWMGIHEVTNKQYEAFDPSHLRYKYSPADDTPVAWVKHSQAVAFVDWLTVQEKGKSGLKFRLPTEAEWEWACHGGKAFLRPNRDELSRSEVNYNGVDGDDLWEYTGPVGKLEANGYGLHQMLGNVSEWVADYYHDFTGAAEVDPLHSAPNGAGFVHKGRSFNNGEAADIMCNGRQSYTPGEYGKKVGFRVVAETTSAPVPAPPQCTSDADCDDHDLCIKDVCASGSCVPTLLPGCCASDDACDDENACTEDSCDLSTHLCAHAPHAGCCQQDLDCKDTDPCTLDRCDPKSHACTHVRDSQCGEPAPTPPPGTTPTTPPTTTPAPGPASTGPASTGPASTTPRLSGTSAASPADRLIGGCAWADRPAAPALPTLLLLALLPGLGRAASRKRGRR